MTFRYLKFCEIGTAVGNEFEDGCLTALKERVLGFTMGGTPVRCISVELVLSGNGLQLADRTILHQTAHLLYPHGYRDRCRRDPNGILLCE